MTCQTAIPQKAERKPLTTEKAIYWFTTGLIFISMIYVIIIITDAARFSDGESSQLTLAFIECVLGLIVIHIPALISKLIGIKLPDVLCIGFYIFIICY